MTADSQSNNSSTATKHPTRFPHRAPTSADVAAGHQFAVRLGSPGPTPPGYDDYETAARQWLGAAPPSTPVNPAGRATVTGETYGQYGAIAAGVAETRGIRPGDRVLIDAAGSEQPLNWLLAPLSVGATIVLCANLDRSRLDTRIASERVTQVFA